MAEGASALSLPDLPPDIRFERLPQTREAFDYAFEVKRVAMGPHITAHWDWDEEFQRQFHEQRFREKPFLRIIHCNVPVGTFALTKYSDHILLDDFYLLPDYHRRGLGTQILRYCLSVADRMRLPVRLRYLRWNPVGSLYRRNGFQKVGETDTHFLMERPPAP
jgi:GNAT superfamily N-acetyltransferase